LAGYVYYAHLIVCYAHEVEKFDDIETIDDYNSPQPRWKAERQRAQSHTCDAGICGRHDSSSRYARRFGQRVILMITFSYLPQWAGLTASDNESLFDANARLENTSAKDYAKNTTRRLMIVLERMGPLTARLDSW
jgi:hypothetical protein